MDTYPYLDIEMVIDRLQNIYHDMSEWDFGIARKKVSQLERRLTHMQASGYDFTKKPKE